MPGKQASTPNKQASTPKGASKPHPAAIERIGIVGAGTMGAGIAQVAALGGFETYLHDPFPEALKAGVERLEKGLQSGARRKRWSAEEAGEALQRLRVREQLDDLRPCELVIEAVPEQAELKNALITELSELCGDGAVLATNTSSLSVSALAKAARRPSLVVGMHFFNPAPLMPLVEVVAGADTEPRAVEVARATAERMGKQVIEAKDGPGFLVNRCGRPFYGEALRLVQEGIADIPTIDRICRMAGFRMGPFELMDLVGIDVGLEVSRSFYEQSFHEPRWKPSLIQVRMVNAGRLGRKSGRGFYTYGNEPHRPEDPSPPRVDGGSGPVTIGGDTVLAKELRVLAETAGYTVSRPGNADTDKEHPILQIDAGLPPSQGLAEEPLPQEAVPTLLLCAESSLAELDIAGDSVGFHLIPPLPDSACVELTRGAGTSNDAAESAEQFFAALGKHTEWVGDAPGLVLGRIACQLVNEACFALTEKVGTATDIDTGMKLGLNYPRGPLEWGDMIGLDHVLTVLDGLADELREDRYRAAPLLRHMVAQGKLGRLTGRGFFDYPD